MPLNINVVRDKLGEHEERKDKLKSIMKGKSASDSQAPVSTGMAGSTDSVSSAYEPAMDTGSTGQAQQQGSQSVKVDESNPFSIFANSLLDPDDEKGQKEFESLIPQIYTPGTGVYSPYVTATNVDALNKLGTLTGHNYSNGISAEEYDELGLMFANYVSPKGGELIKNPNGNYQAPSSNNGWSKKKIESDPQLYEMQQKAYAWSNAGSAEKETRKVEEQFRQFLDDVAYYTSRTDMNYSDQDVLQLIDWEKKYPELKAMQENANNGGATRLNRAVNFSTNLMQGYMWAARNPDMATGNAQYDAMYAALGVGNVWQYNDNVNKYLETDSPDYNIYKVASTMEPLMRKLRVTSFGDEWLDAAYRKEMVNSGKVTQEEAGKIRDAVVYTNAARTDATALNNYVKFAAHNDIDINFDDPQSDDYIFKEKEIKYYDDNGQEITVHTDKLKEMFASLNEKVNSDGTKSRIPGKLKDTSGAIDFEMNDLRREYEVEKNSTPEWDQQFTDAFGPIDGAYYGADDVGQLTASAMKKLREALLTGTPEERDLATLLGPDEDPTKKWSLIQKYVDSGALTREEAAMLNYRVVEDLVSDTYYQNHVTVTRYEDAKKSADDWIKELGKAGYEYDENWKSKYQLGDQFENDVNQLAEKVGWANFQNSPIEALRGYKTPEGVEPGSVEDKLRYIAYVSALDFDDLAQVAINQPYYSQEFMLSLGPDFDRDRATNAAVENLRDEFAALSNVGGEGFTMDDLIADYIADVTQAGFYAYIRQSQRIMDHYGKDLEKAQGALDKINTMVDDAWNYGVDVYGKPLFYADNKANLSGHMNSYGLDRIDKLMAAANAIAYIGNSDHTPQAGQLVAHYEMLANPTTDAAKEEIMAMLKESGIEVKEGTDLTLLGQVYAARWLDNKLEELKKRQEALNGIDRMVDIYGINLDEFERMEWQKNTTAENYRSYADDVNSAISQLELRIEARQDDDFSGYVEAFKKRATGLESVALLANGFLNGKELPDSAADAHLLDKEDWEMYAYLYEKKGADAAKEFYTNIVSEGGSALVKRMMNTQQSAIDKANSGFWGAALGSLETVIASPAQLAGWMYSIGQKFRGENIDAFNPSFLPSAYISTFRGQVEENIESVYGKTLAWLYQTGMSGADSLYNSAMMGPIFGGFTSGGVSTASRLMHTVLGSFGSASMMAAEAAGSTVWSARMSGVDSDTAFAMGAVSFCAESITEAITFGNISAAFDAGEIGVDGIKKGIGEFFKDILSDMPEEAFGEGMSEIINAVGQFAVANEQSEYTRLVNHYKDLGMDDMQAMYYAIKDIAGDVAMAAISGAVMTVGTTGLSYLAGSMKTAIGKAYYGADNYMDQVYAVEGAKIEDNYNLIGERLKKAEDALEKNNSWYNKALVNDLTKQFNRAADQMMDWEYTVSERLGHRMDSYQDLDMELEDDIQVRTSQMNAMQTDAEGFEGMNPNAAPAPILTPEQIRANYEARVSQNAEQEAQMIADAENRRGGLESNAAELRDMNTVKADEDAATASAQAEQELHDSISPDGIEQSVQEKRAELDQWIADTEAGINEQAQRHEQAVAEAEAGRDKKVTENARRKQSNFEQWADGQRREIENRQREFEEWERNWRNGGARDAAFERYNQQMAAIHADHETAVGQINTDYDTNMQVASDLYAEDVDNARKNREAADLQAQEEADNENNRYVNEHAAELREQYSIEASDQKRLAAEAEATAKAAADRAFEEARGKATKKFSTDYAKALAARNKTIANASSDAVKKGANTRFANTASKLASIERNEIATAQGIRDAAYQKAQEDRSAAEAEAEQALQEKLSKLPAEPVAVPVGPTETETEGANEVLGISERIAQATEGLMQAWTNGDGNGVMEKRGELNNLRALLTAAVNKVKAGIQERMESGGAGISVEDQQKIDMTDEVLKRMQNVLNVLGGESANAQVNAQTTPNGQPAGIGGNGPAVNVAQAVAGNDVSTPSAPQEAPINAETVPATPAANIGEAPVVDAAAEAVGADASVPVDQNVPVNPATAPATPAGTGAAPVVNAAENVVGTRVGETTPVAPEVNPEIKGGPVNENGEQITTEETGEQPAARVPTELTPELREMLDGFADAVRGMVDSLRGAFDFSKTQQENKTRAEAEINLRAMVLDAYNGVKGFIEQVRSAYDEYQKARASNDADAAKVAREKLSRFFTNLKDAWTDFYNARINLKTGVQTETGETTDTQPAAADPFMMATAALNQGSAAGNKALTFSTVTGVMTNQTYQSDRNATSWAGAATQAMFKLFGMDSTVQGLRHSLYNAYGTGVDIKTLKGAITNLALGNDQANAVLRQLFSGQINAQEAVAAASEMTTPETFKILQRKVADFQKVMEYRRLAAAGEVEKQITGQKANLNTANRKMEQARGELDGAVQECMNRYQELQDAMDEYDRIENMTDRESSTGPSGRAEALKAASNAVTAATKANGNAISVVRVYQQRFENAKQAQAAAQQAYNTARENATMNVWAHAAQNVAQFNAQNEAAVNAEIAAMNAQAAQEADDAQAAVVEGVEAIKAEAQKSEQKAAERAEQINRENNAPAQNDGVDRLTTEPGSNRTEGAEPSNRAETESAEPESAAEEFKTQFSDGNWSFDPSKTEKTGSSAPVESGTKIITDWLDKIGMKYETSRRRYAPSKRGRALGYTQRDSGIIHVWDTSNMEVAWHEIGHVFDSKFGLSNSTQTQAMIDKMRQDRYWALWFDQYSDEAKPREAIAEAIGLWLADRDGAIDVCGEEFIRHLEECIDKAGWTKATMEMKEAWKRNREANSAGRAMGYVQLLANPDGFKKIVRGWKEILFDHSHPLYQIALKQQAAGMYSADKDVRTLEKLRDRRAGNTMNSFINIGITLPGTDALMLDKNGKPYESLGELLGKIKKQDIQAFNTYMLLVHAQDRQLTNVDFDKIADAEELARMKDRIKEVFGADVDVNAALAEMKAAHPEFEQIGNRLREIYNAVVKAWAVDTGLMDKDTYYRFRKRWPHYVPTYRVGESQHNPQAAVTGSTKNIYNPIVSLVENMNRYVSDYYNQEVLRAFDDFMTTKGVDHMGIAEETHVHSGSDVVKVKLEDGTERYWAIKDDSILKALTYSSNMPADAFMKAIGKVGNLTRFLAATSTAWSLGFAIQNFVSDTETALVTGDSALTVFDYGVHLLKSAWILATNMNKNAGDMDERVRYYKMYAEMGSRYAYRNKTGVKELHRELYDNEGGAKKKALDALKHPIATIEDITGFFEDLTRFNEFRMAGEERSAFMKKWLGKNYQQADLSTEAGRLLAARKAADVTTDFGQSGSSNLLPAISRLVPFFNASMQGMYKTLRMFSNDNSGRRVFMGAKLAINSAIMGAAIAALRGMSWDDDEKEAYEQLNYYERAQYYHIKLGDGKFLRFRRSQDAFIGLGSIFGEMIGSVTTGLENDPFSVFVNVGQQIAQNAFVDPKSNIFSPLVDAYFNKTWSGGNIENSTMLDMNMLDRYEAAEGSSALYRSLSAIANMLPVVKELEYSPADMKYIIGQYTGTFGTIGTGLIDNLIGMMTGSYNKDLGSAIWEPVRDKIVKKFSVDPVYSNRITSDYKDAAAFIQGIPAAVDAGERTAVLRMDLSEQDYKMAVKEAEKLTGKDGQLTKMSKDISKAWTEYYKILNNEKLPDGEREVQAQKAREKINDMSMKYTAIVNQYRINYGYTTPFLKSVAGSEMGQNAAGVILPYVENALPGNNKKKK